MNDHITKPLNVYRMYETLIRWAPPRSTAAAAAQAGANSPSMLLNTPLQLERIDVASGLRICMGKLPLYQRLLRKFISAEQDFSLRFDSAKAALDFPAMTLAAHTFKSSAGTLGAGDLHSAAAALELACKALSEDEIATALATVTALLPQTLATITAYVNTLPQSDAGQHCPVEAFSQQALPAPVDCAQFATLLQSLLQQLEAADAGARETAEKLRIVGQESDWHAATAELFHAVFNYNYDSAIKQTQSLIQRLSAAS